MPWNLQHRVFNSTIFPYWTESALYYFQQSVDKTMLVRIDLATGVKEPVLDYSDLIDSLALQLKQVIKFTELPFNIFSMQENPLQLRFNYKNNRWHYDLTSHQCVQGAEDAVHVLKSPDQKWALSTQEHNLVLIDLIHNQHLELTMDGERYYDYASSPETNTRAITQRLAGIVLPPVALWSPDSTKIVTHKLDQRNVKELFLLQNAPNGSQRPILHGYKMSFSGDDQVPLAELVVIDIIENKMVPLNVEPLLAPYLTPLEFKWVWWGDDSQKIYFLNETRSSKKLSLCVADAKTGDVKVLITEVGKTYVEPSQFFLWPPQIIILEENRGIIWLSECSGYSHLYLYGLGDNISKYAITSGEWCVREVHFYDQKTDWLYFTACGYYKNRDPYYKQLFRCHLNGSDLQCLTEENAYHTISISPNKKYFLDTFSTIDTPPMSILKSIDGKMVCDVEVADIRELKKLNWAPPKRFCVMARDHTTPIYGNLYFPSNFDPNKKYPLIDHIYPGPQVYRTSPHFNMYGVIFRSTWMAQALAEVGFIVMHVDGFGTPGRSKAFHDLTYQNISDCGIPDHVSAIKQVSDQYQFIDINKIGITGFSGGAFAAVRAMLQYPEVFKVAVAAAGNHDLRCYPASYGEKYNSLDASTYNEQSNAAYAHQLDGKLLLIHGEMDDNVHPCATLQLVDALIKHNKDFDMLMMPNQNHPSTFDHPYYMRRHWDYFVQHLLNKSPPKNYCIAPMPPEFMQIIDW